MRQHQLYDERTHGGHNQDGANPESDVARLHQRWEDAQRKHIVTAVLERVEIPRDFQIEAGIKPEHQANDNGNGERDQ